MSLLVVGSVAFDAIETPHAKTDKIIGGAGTYINFSAGNLVDKLNLVAVVGEDFPQEYIEKLKAHGADTEGLQIKHGKKSFFWSGKYFDNMNQRETLITELNVLEHFDPILPESYKNSKYIMLGNLSPQVQNLVLDRLNSKPEVVVLDTMNFWMDIAMDELRKVIARSTVLTINDEEARQLSGKYNLVEAAEEILNNNGPEFLIIKKGEHGALLFDRSMQMFYCPAMPLNPVVDPTGAGDCFAGGLIAYLAKEGKCDFETLKSAILYGSVMASFCVQKMGTEGVEFVGDEKIQQRLAYFRSLMTI